MALASAWPTSPNATWQRCSTTGRPPITTWVTSAAVAANTTWSMRSSGRAPASRGEALVQLQGAGLLEQVDDGVAVAADAQRAAGGGQRRGGADAVGQVALGGRAHADGRAGGAEAADVVVAEPGGVDRGGARTEHAAAVGQGRGRQSGDRQALVVLGALLGQVQVQRRGPLRRPGRDLPHGARVQRPHAVDAGGDPQGRASLELPDPLGPGGGVAVAEAQLRAFERATLEVAPEVAGVDQGETDA